MRVLVSFLMTLVILYHASRTCGNSLVPDQDAGPAPDSHWELFLDDHIITRSTGFQRVVHHPEPRGIVLEGTESWEEPRGVTPLYVGRRQDSGYEMYYRAHGSIGAVTAYALSDDGIHWEKPNLGLVDTPWGKENNLVPCKQPRDLLLHGNVRDPSKRFVFCHDDRTKNGVYFASQPLDFINDPHAIKNLVDTGGHLGCNHNTVEFWDDIHNEWVAMRQAPNHPPVRCGGRYSSASDLIDWKLDHFLYSRHERFHRSAILPRSLWDHVRPSGGNRIGVCILVYRGPNALQPRTL